jgi:hypothetical protein
MTSDTFEPSTRDVYGVDHDVDDVDFFWGVASGGTHAALKRAVDDADLPTPDHAMVSATTQINGIWAGPDWMVDCGGSPDSIKANGGHPLSISDYLDYLEAPPTRYGDAADDVTLDRFALRDWPCEPAVRDILDASVDDLQRRTVDDHIRMLDALDSRDIDADPVAVIQGWDVDDYLRHVDMMRDHGLLTDHVGIGSVCRRGSPGDIRDVVYRVRRNLPARVQVHGFGVKKSVLDAPDTLTVFDSVDSAAWENRLRWANKDGIQKSPPQSDLSYADWGFWDGDGNPRYKWENVQTCYLGYRDQIRRLTPDDADGETVVDLADWGQVQTGLGDYGGGNADGYPVLKCVCGTLIDPGRPDPMPRPGCRFCERAGINIWDRHIAARDRTLVGDAPA